MPRRDIDPAGSLGDIDFILHNQGVADLSWLSINEDDYRSFEALPKQNLDIIPELQRALVQDDEGIPHIIPLRPHTIVNTNPAYQSTGQSAATTSVTPIRNRVAQLLIKGLPISEINGRLRLEFDQSSINASKSDIEDLVKEQGLIGNVYINSSHFPRCHQGDGKDFVSKYAKRALYVIANDKCPGCIHNKDARCLIFQKRLISNIPYDEKLVSQYSERLAAEGRSIRSYGDVRERLKEAFLKPIVPYRDPIPRIIEQHNHEYKPTAAEINEYLNLKPQKLAKNDILSPAYIKYAIRMMTNHDDRDVLTSSTDPKLRILAKQHGILGHTYLDMDALGGCKKTARFILTHKSAYDYLVRRSAVCNVCKNISDGYCAQLSKKYKIVRNESEVLNKTAFGLALKRAVNQKRLTLEKAKLAFNNVSDSANFASLIKQINFYEPQKEIHKGTNHINVHYGTPNSATTIDIDPERVRQTVSHLMNIGLSGRVLKKALLNVYTAEELSNIFGRESENYEIGKVLAANDGIQGFHFIDPTAYSDYGKGCKQGSEKFWRKGAPRVLAGSKCTGCNLQIAPGWCSRYAKELIRSVPESERTNAREKSLPVITSYENPVEKYELSPGMEFTVHDKKLKEININLVSSGRIPD